MGENADKSGPHILSRFDGDIGDFRALVLDMGQLAVEQVALAARAVSECDITAVSGVRDNYRNVVSMDMGLLESNINLLAIYQPLATDLRYMVMLSRTAYDLERIQQEALRLADLAEVHHSQRGSRSHCDIFDDVPYLGEEVTRMLSRTLEAVAEGSEVAALEVARRPAELREANQGALRRLATYIMQDPRLVQSVINATVALESLGRVADHSIGIARNVIFAVSGKDVRHLNVLNLDRAFLRS